MSKSFSDIFSDEYFKKYLERSIADSKQSLAAYKKMAEGYKKLRKESYPQKLFSDAWYSDTVKHYEKLIVEETAFLAEQQEKYEQRCEKIDMKKLSAKEKKGAALNKGFTVIRGGLCENV